MKNTLFLIEAELEVKRLQVYLQKHPEQAFQLAVKHFQDYLGILLEYKNLIEQRQSISPHTFSTPRQIQLETEYEDQDTFYLF